MYFTHEYPRGSYTGIMYTYHITANGEHYFFLILTTEAKFCKYLPVCMWWWYRPSGGHVLFTIRKMKAFHFHLGGLQRKTSKRMCHFCFQRKSITLYEHLNWTSALLPMCPLKETLFRWRKLGFKAKRSACVKLTSQWHKQILNLQVNCCTLWTLE